MRKLLPLLLLALLATCRKFDNPFDPANNRPPDAPADPTPAAGAAKQDTVGLVLTWTCADPDSIAGDEPSYDVYFGTASQPPRADTALVTNSWSPGALGVGVTYYWRIIARDTRGDTTAGPVWSFATNANLKPTAPSSPTPLDGTSGLPATSVNLAWASSDPNPGDSLVYDLYLGRSSPPPLVAAGLTEPRWTATGLAYGAPYYWQVIVRDQDSAETAGPVWQFMTMSQVVFSLPVGGEKWRIGSLKQVRWSGGTFAAPAGRARSLSQTTVRARAKALAPGGTDEPDSTVFYRSNDGGSTWQRDGLVTTSGQYDWTVTGPEVDGAQVQVRLYVGTEQEWASSAPFYAYNPPSSIVVTAPTSGVRWRVGESQTIRWTGGTDGRDSTVIFHSTDNGSSWTRQGRATQAGQYAWTVPGPETNSALVRVRAYMGSDQTNGQSGQFTVYSLSPVTVTEPNDSTRWRMQSYQTVRWEGGTDVPDSSVIYFRPDGSAQWQRQGAGTAGSYLWLVPGQTASAAEVQVRAWRLGTYESGNGGPFGIYDTMTPSTPVVTSPAGGERWEIGSEHDITWTGGTDGMDSTVVLFSTNNGSNWLRQGSVRLAGGFHWTVPGPSTDQARIGLQAWCLGRPAEGVSNQFRVSGATFPDTVVATVAVGDRPTAACFNERANKLYVANRNAGTVSVIDGDGNNVVATITAGSFPSALACDTARNRAYCTNEGARTLTVIDCAADTVVATVDVGAAPRAVCVNPASAKVYVANYGTGANSVTVIDAATNAVITTVACGERPRALAWNPVNNRVYVACYASNSVTVIDGASNEMLDSIGVGWSPCAVVVVEDQNHVYVANSGTSSNSVTVINAVNNGIIEHVAVGTGPCALSWNSTAGKVYVANEAAASVSVIRTATRQVAAVIGVGSQPGAVTWAGRYNMAYVSCRGSDQVAIINGTSDSREKTLAVGDEPVALAWNTTAGKVYVANYAAGTVSVIASQ